MSAPTLSVVRTSPDLITVAIPGRDASRDAVREARKLAAGAAHTLVGGAQNARNASHEGRQVTLVDFAPVQRRQAGESRTVGDEARELLATLPEGPARTLLESALASVGRKARPTAADLGIVIPDAPKAETTFEPVARAKSASCKTCRDLGVVRGVGANAGKPYRTQAGADAATAAGRSVPCTAKHRRSA